MSNTQYDKKSFKEHLCFVAGAARFILDICSMLWG